MAWKDELLPASFRGVEFKVDGSQRTGGRRNVVHEYPGRDEAFAEDMGRRVRRFTLKAYVIGAEYMAQRRKLETALEQAGPGELIHPYHGTRLVAIDGDFTVDETTDEGGLARIEIPFVETVAAAFSPNASRSALALTESSAAAARTAAGTQLLKSYATKLPVSGGITLTPRGLTKSLPGFTFTSVAALLADAGGGLRAALQPVVTGQERLASLKRTMDTLLFDAGALVRNPINLVNRWGALLDTFQDWPITSRLGFTAFTRASQFETTAARPTAPTTATRLREQVNFDATDAYLRQALITRAAENLATAAAVPFGARQPALAFTTARTAADISTIPPDGFDSYADAVAARDTLVAAIDAQLVTATDDVYAAFVQLRADVLASVPADDVSLPRLLTVTPVTTVPVLAEAYRLYGSIELADDLAARNHVSHPGFLMGGRPLQVLSRA